MPATLSSELTDDEGALLGGATEFVIQVGKGPHGRVVARVIKRSRTWTVELDYRSHPNSHVSVADLFELDSTLFNHLTNHVIQDLRVQLSL